MEEVLANLETWRVRTLELLGEITGTPRELVEDDLSVAAVLELDRSGLADAAAAAAGNDRNVALAEALSPPADVLRVLSECATTGLTCVQWNSLRLLLACQIRAAAEEIAGTSVFAAHVRALLDTDAHETGGQGRFALDALASRHLTASSLPGPSVPQGGGGDGGDGDGGGGGGSGTLRANSNAAGAENHSNSASASALPSLQREHQQHPPHMNVLEDENPTLIGVLDELDGFLEAPFTLQRLCELTLGYRDMFLPDRRRDSETGHNGQPVNEELDVSTPHTRLSLHGSPLDKFVFALDRTLRVRSTLPTLTPAEYNSCVQRLVESRAVVEAESAEILARTEARLAMRPPREVTCTIERGPPLRRGGVAQVAQDSQVPTTISSIHFQNAHNSLPESGPFLDSFDPYRPPFTAADLDAFAQSSAIADVLAAPLPGEYLDSAGELGLPIDDYREHSDDGLNGNGDFHDALTTNL